MRSLASTPHRESINWVNGGNRSNIVRMWPCESAHSSAARLTIITNVFTIIFNKRDALVASSNQLRQTDAKISSAENKMDSKGEVGQEDRKN